jgi:hypothetical protein
MECNKWQETGLLFISKELDKQEELDFTEHLKKCETCKNELQQYLLDKDNFFSQSVLSECTSTEIDNKILAVCLKTPVITSGLSLFTGVWMKKALLSAFFLVFGISAGVYFTMNYFTDKNSSAVAATKSAQTTVASTDQNVIKKAPDTSKANKKDSAWGRETNPAMNQPQRRIPQQGIITVDLKKE